MIIRQQQQQQQQMFNNENEFIQIVMHSTMKFKLDRDKVDQLSRGFIDAP